MDKALKNQKIEITQNAASRLKNIIANEEAGSKGIRVTIDTGGCSGMSYKITFEDEQKELQAFAARLEEILGSEVELLGVK